MKLKGMLGRLKRVGWLVLLMALAGVAQAQTQAVVRYVHTDALGSVVAITDQNRVVIERREYEPYGQQLTPAVQDGPGYTGHVQDAATGLTYMQQRYYDPICGCFLSVDPVTAYDSGDWRYFNRYAYAFGNPCKFTDPDGRCFTCNFLPIPIEGRTNPYAPIPGASRGDAILVGGAATIAGGAAVAAIAVSVGAPAMVMSAAEGASLQTGLAAQQGLNVGTNAAIATGAAAAGTLEGELVRDAYIQAVANPGASAAFIGSAAAETLGLPGPPPASSAEAAGIVTVGAIQAVTNYVESAVNAVTPPPPPPKELERR